MVKTKVLMILLLSLFMISFASAANWDNVYDYNEETKTAIVENWLGFGSDLAFITLTSPQNVMVARGKDRLVGEFNFTTTGNFMDTFGDIYLEDVKSGNEISRGKQFKYKKYTEIRVDDYETFCENVMTGNGTVIKNCIQIEIGNHLEIQMNWIPINNPTNIFYEGVTYEIGVFVDVEKDDYGDWIPSIMGVEIEEWATWTEDLNVDLELYLKLEGEFTPIVLASVGVNNGTDEGSDNRSGIIGSARNFTDILGERLLFPTDPSLNFGTGDFSACAWIYPSGTNSTQRLMGKDAHPTETTGWFFSLEPDNKMMFATRKAGAGNYMLGDEVYTDGVWAFVCGVREAGVLSIYKDGVWDKNLTESGSTNVDYATDFRIGTIDETLNARWGGGVDEVSLYSRALTPSEIIQQYNDGDGITWTEDFFNIITTLNEPENNTMQNDATVDFNWTITPINLNITNWTLNVWFTNNTLVHQHINTSINTNQTTTVIHNDTLFLDDSYIWNVESCGSDGVNNTCDLSVNWTFTLDTVPPIVNITYPPEGFIVTTPLQNITLNYTVDHPVGNLSNCFYNTTSNSTSTIINCTTNTTSLLYPISNPDNLTIYVFANDTASNLGEYNVTIYKDTVVPQIEIEAPSDILGYNAIGLNETLNATFTDTNLESCWYDYNGTNITIEGCLTGVKNSTQFILEADNLNMTLYANDSLGNLNSSFIEWEYILLELNSTFEENITEAEINNFSILVDVSNGGSLTEAIFLYNNTNYTTTIIFSSGLYLLSASIISPSVNEDINFSFNFFVVIDGITYETVSNNQTVINSLFDICGGASDDLLLNMSLIDEEMGSIITGDIEVLASIISKSSGASIGSINKTFDDVNYGAICFSPPEDFPLYYLYAEIRYFADGYATETYYIQKADLTDYPRNLSLFDLNQTDSTEFVITYKNDAFIFVEGAVIQLQRKYIGEGIYKVVEAPITSDGGKALVHIDLNNVVYRATVVKDGEVLDIFEGIVFDCGNELAGECEESLEGTVNPNNDIPIEELTDFTYSVSIDEDNQTVTVLFSVPSGTPSNINVLLNQIDTFGNLTACNTTIITSAGSITCDYTDSIEQNILELSISKNDIQLVILSYSNNPKLDMDGINFFIVFLFMISLVGMAISSPEWMLIISVMILMISGTLLLVSGMNLVIGLGGIAWLIVAVGIIIFKIAKQEDR